MSAKLNPDCREGKHHACGGDAWDYDLDTATKCECVCHGVTAAREAFRATHDVTRMDWSEVFNAGFIDGALSILETLP